MFPRSTVIRVLAIPACLVWGLVELLALQRAHRVSRLHSKVLGR
jgi:hypothetical protein